MISAAAIIRHRIGAFALAAAWLTNCSAAATQTASEIAPAGDPASFIVSTLVTLGAGLAGLAVLAGLAMRQAGLGGAGNMTIAWLKPIGVYALSALCLWLVGFEFMRSVEPGGLLGVPALWAPADADGAARAEAAEFFRIIALAAIAAAIPAGALADRARLWPYFIFAAIFLMLIFPILAGWTWGGGRLSADFGFIDKAGAAVVHIAGGAAGLAGAAILGPRHARSNYAEARPAASMPLVAFGALMFWIGWLGTLGAAQDGLADVQQAVNLARAFVNVSLAAGAGVIVALILTQMIYKKVDVAVILNAAIGAMAAMSADPFAPALWQSVVLGGFAGAIVTVAGPALDRLRLDDPAGVVPAHLLCGVLGAIMPPWFSQEATFVGQAVGAVMIAAFAFAMSGLVFIALRYTIGLRVAARLETDGLDPALIAAAAHLDQTFD